MQSTKVCSIEQFARFMSFIEQMSKMGILLQIRWMIEF